jgi:hypothetical protein
VSSLAETHRIFDEAEKFLQEHGSIQDENTENQENHGDEYAEIE